MQTETNSNTIKPKELELMQYNHKTIAKVLNRDLWALRYRIDGKQKTVYGKTQKLCIEKYKKRLKQKTIPKPAEPPKSKTYTLKEWYEKFKQLYKVNKVKDTTIEKDNYTLKVFSKLYDTQLNELTAIQVLEQLNKIKDKPTKKKNAYILLNSMLEKAKNNEIIDKNIMKTIDIPKYKAPERQVFTKTQEQMFVKMCSNNKYGNFYLICLYQGLRSGECRALKVNDVDFINNTLKIDESINFHTKRTNTKNEQSNRVIPIFSNAKPILQKLIKNKSNNEFLFDYRLKEINTNLKNMLKEFNFKKFTNHNLRHTFITRCQEKNIPLYVIQAWVGHEKGSAVTTKIYTHLSQETNLKYAEILNNKE